MLILGRVLVMASFTLTFYFFVIPLHLCRIKLQMIGGMASESIQIINGNRGNYFWFFL